MGWSGGVLKGSCAAFGEEGRGLGEEPAPPVASSWILTPITDPGTEWDAKSGGSGEESTLEAALTQATSFQQDVPGAIKCCVTCIQ